MPQYAPAPQRNPYLPALEEETIWWLREGRTASHFVAGLGPEHRARFLESLRAAVRFEGETFEQTHSVNLEASAKKVITGALYAFIREPADEWQVQPEAHWRNARHFVVTLPARLHAVWIWKGRPSSLSAATIQEWLTENISSICPYICPA
jgi:hypothetical protein